MKHSLLQPALLALLLLSLSNNYFTASAAEGDSGVVEVATWKQKGCPSQYPSHRPPSGCYGWSNCGGNDYWKCSAPCKQPYWVPDGSYQPYCECNGGSWGPIQGGCKPDPKKNCIYSKPPMDYGIHSWDCYGSNDGSYPRTCKAKCKTGYKHYYDIPTCQCSGYTGDWGPIYGGCVPDPSYPTPPPPDYPTPPPSTCVYPDFAPPPGTYGWIDCNPLVGGQYTYQCRAPCKPGYTADNGQVPTTMCKVVNGVAIWTDGVGQCSKQIINGCTVPPNIDAPDNTQGWSEQYCIGVSKRSGNKDDSYYICKAPCLSGCYPDPTAPESTCYATDGTWSTPQGSCTCGPPPPQDCRQQSVPVQSAPPNTYGWDSSKCYTTGVGTPTRTCLAECAEGFVGVPTTPMATCDYGTGKWSSTRGVCKPKDNGYAPCYGYPTGGMYFFNNGCAAKWPTSCGGKGYCTSRRSYATPTCGGSNCNNYCKNYGYNCKNYCACYVSSGSTCEAMCVNGSGKPRATCVNGVWTMVDGQCYC